MEHFEIERKFLVGANEYRSRAIKKTRITQGFLNTNVERTVRVRIAGDKAFLTVKGKSNDEGTSRFEWETPIAVDEAQLLIPLCDGLVIDKIRYEVPFGDHVFEVDEFLRENKGLVIAEIELKHKNETFGRPPWLGTEVTGHPEYYNSQLTINPYKTWI